MFICMVVALFPTSKILCASGFQITLSGRNGKERSLSLELASSHQVLNFRSRDRHSVLFCWKVCRDWPIDVRSRCLSSFALRAHLENSLYTFRHASGFSALSLPPSISTYLFYSLPSFLSLYSLSFLSLFSLSFSLSLFSLSSLSLSPSPSLLSLSLNLSHSLSSLSLTLSLFSLSLLFLSYNYISGAVGLLLHNQYKLFGFSSLFFSCLIQLVHAENKKRGRNEERKKNDWATSIVEEKNHSHLGPTTDLPWQTCQSPCAYGQNFRRAEEEKISPDPQKKRRWETGQRKHRAKRSYCLFNVLENALNYEWTTLLTLGGWKFLRKARTETKALLKRM